jgi:hypothetical protein
VSSAYPESIWLYSCRRLDLLETACAQYAHAPERKPARGVEQARTIASETRLSNRQVWNNARSSLPHEFAWTAGRVGLAGPSGLVRHLTSGLLADGTWYEGENYHLFAHRGLWYGVTIANTAGVRLDPALVARFDEAFATPFLTALPDFTFPSRRDSQ